MFASGKFLLITCKEKLQLCSPAEAALGPERAGGPWGPAVQGGVRSRET